MTVRDLNELLTKYPDEMEIFVADEMFGGPDSLLEAADFELYEAGCHQTNGVSNDACLLVSI